MAPLDQPVAALKDLQADGELDGRGGFVGDEDRGLGGQHHGDHDALTPTARELVRIGAGDAPGHPNWHRLEHRHRPLAGLAPARRLMQPAGLADPLAHADDGGGRNFRGLQDHREAAVLPPALPPTMRRAKASTTKATWAKPVAVAPSVHPDSRHGPTAAMARRPPSNETVGGELTVDRILGRGRWRCR